MRMTLFTPGDQWGGGDDGDAEYRRPNDIFQLPRFSSLQPGRNGANGITGFYFKKYNEISIAGNANRSHTNLNVIRYPEVLLIYAEALYKMNGTLTQTEIDETINRLKMTEAAAVEVMKHQAVAVVQVVVEEHLYLMELM